MRKFESLSDNELLDTFTSLWDSIKNKTDVGLPYAEYMEFQDTIHVLQELKNEMAVRWIASVQAG